MIFTEKAEKLNYFFQERKCAVGTHLTEHQGIHVRGNLTNASQQERIQPDASTPRTKSVNLSPRPTGRASLASVLPEAL